MAKNYTVSGNKSSDYRVKADGGQRARFTGKTQGKVIQQTRTHMRQNGAASYASRICKVSFGRLMPCLPKRITFHPGRQTRKYYPAYHCSRDGHCFHMPQAEFNATIERFVKSIELEPQHIDKLLEMIEVAWRAKQQQRVQNDQQLIEQREALEAQIRVTVDPHEGYNKRNRPKVHGE